MVQGFSGSEGLIVTVTLLESDVSLLCIVHCNLFWLVSISEDRRHRSLTGLPCCCGPNTTFRGTHLCYTGHRIGVVLNLLLRVSEAWWASVFHFNLDFCIVLHCIEVNQSSLPTEPSDKTLIKICETQALLELLGHFGLWPGVDGCHFTLVHFHPIVIMDVA